MKRILVALAAAAVVVTGSVVAVTAPAHAATPECVAVAGAACSSIDTPADGGVDLDVWQRRAVADTPIKTWTESAADPAEDFVLIPVSFTGLTGLYPGLTDVLSLLSGQTVNIEYAPDGSESGLCVSVIAAAAYTHTALRPCDLLTAANPTFNQYQTFDRIPVPGDGSFYSLQNVLTGLALTVPPSGAPGAAVVSAAPGQGVVNGPSAGQLFEPNG